MASQPDRSFSVSGAPEHHLVIKPSPAWPPPEFSEMWHSRDLLIMLAGRDLRLRYRQTVLGVLWIVLQPLLGAAVFSLVFGRIARLPAEGVPYFIFAYTGLVFWNLFSNILNRSSHALVQNAHLISKVFFPRLLLPLSGLVAALVDFAVGFAVLLGVLLFYRPTSLPGLSAVPLVMLILVALSLGAGLMAGALMVRYRDLQHLLPILLQLLLYVSPVGYAVSAVPNSLQWVYGINPLSAPIEAARSCLLGTRSLDPMTLLYPAALSVSALVLGTALFKRAERAFADVI